MAKKQPKEGDQKYMYEVCTDIDQLGKPSGPEDNHGYFDSKKKAVKDAKDHLKKYAESPIMVHVEKCLAQWDGYGWEYVDFAGEYVFCEHTESYVSK